MTIIEANANPEKRLFISLITRDISLVAAFLDLIDNSVNAAVEPHSAQLQTAKDYLDLFQDDSVTPKVNINLNIDDSGVSISDNAAGIAATTASEHVFKFGRSSEEANQSDRLSVYGIGMKRAIFKLGNKIKIESNHINGGFTLDLDVEEWAKDKNPRWTFPLNTREPSTPESTGTSISISELHEDTRRRIADGLFLNQLREAISRTYNFYLAKFTNIFVNGEQIFGTEISIGDNRASEQVVIGQVTCAITAGIGVTNGGTFKDKSSGWFVFCNGRTVISADKSTLTGWGTGPLGLPLYQPKHRAFIGTVFFVSNNSEALPWTTTKSGINEDSSVWQEAKRNMSVVGRQVISFLDSRYTDEGTEIPSADLKEAAGKSISVISAAAAPRTSFSLPKKPATPTTSIQFEAKLEDVKRIAQYLGRRSMSAREVGRYTFDYFLKNEVGDE